MLATGELLCDDAGAVVGTGEGMFTGANCEASGVGVAYDSALVAVSGELSEVVVGEVSAADSGVTGVGDDASYEAGAVSGELFAVVRIVSAVETGVDIEVGVGVGVMVTVLVKGWQRAKVLYIAIVHAQSGIPKLAALVQSTLGGGV